MVDAADGAAVVGTDLVAGTAVEAGETVGVGTPWRVDYPDWTRVMGRKMEVAAEEMRGRALLSFFASS